MLRTVCGERGVQEPFDAARTQPPTAHICCPLNKSNTLRLEIKQEYPNQHLLSSQSVQPPEARNQAGVPETSIGCPLDPTHLLSSERLFRVQGVLGFRI
jgi:hypothetical protein